MTQVMA